MPRQLIELAWSCKEFFPVQEIPNMLQEMMPLLNPEVSCTLIRQLSLMGPGLADTFTRGCDIILLPSGLPTSHFPSPISSNDRKLQLNSDVDVSFGVDRRVYRETHDLQHRRNGV
jgi:hypothetical protein